MGLILASGSPIRRQMLEAAGVAFDVVVPGIDESAIKASDDDAAVIALALAGAKALAAGTPGWAIGSDSIVTVAGRRFDKPADRDEAADHLRFFSGKAMTLTSAVALARDGRVDWSIADAVRLEVRELGEDFIRAYLDAEWPEVAYCVGVFRMEGRGIQLFDKVEGSHFTILGMPLLPLLGALRERGLVAA